MMIIKTEPHGSLQSNRVRVWFGSDIYCAMLLAHLLENVSFSLSDSQQWMKWSKDIASGPWGAMCVKFVICPCLQWYVWTIQARPRHGLYTCTVCVWTHLLGQTPSVNRTAGLSAVHFEVYLSLSGSSMHCSVSIVRVSFFFFKCIYSIHTD